MAMLDTMAQAFGGAERTPNTFDYVILNDDASCF